MYNILNDWGTRTFCGYVVTWYDLLHPQFAYFHLGTRPPFFGYFLIPINFMCHDSFMAYKFSVYESSVYESSAPATAH